MEHNKILGPQINAVLKVVTQVGVGGSEKTTILVYALAIACRSIDAKPESVIKLFKKAMASDIKLVPLEQAEQLQKKGMN